MKDGFVRLTKISLVVVIVISALVFVLNNTAKTFQYTQMHNPLMEQDSWLILDGGLTENTPIHTRKAFQQARISHPDAILKVDIQKTRDHKWVVFPDRLLSPRTNKDGPISNFTLSELSDIDFSKAYTPEALAMLPNQDQLAAKTVFTLEEFLASYSDGPILLNVVTPQQFDPQGFLQLLKKYKKERTDVIIMSNASHIAGSLKKEAPLYLYVADTSLFSKAYLLSQFFMESVGQFHADVFIGPLKSTTQTPLTPRLIKELNRRKKKVIITSDSWPEKALGADGIMTSRPKSL